MYIYVYVNRLLRVSRILSTDPSQGSQAKRKISLEVAQWSCSYKKFKRLSRVGYG